MKDDFRKTNISFSFLIHFLYGDESYRLLKDNHSLSDAKNFYLKIIKSINYAIEETIKITDNHHKHQLLNLINKAEQSIKLSKSFDNLDQQMISFQSEMIFLLIGFMPHRWQQQKVINKRSEWKLDTYRQIQYIQDLTQKKNLIFHAVQGKYKERFGSWNDFLNDIFHNQCHNDPNELIIWFKNNHPDIYLDLF